MVYKKGIHWDSEVSGEFKKFQEKASKWDSLVKIRKEIRECKSKIKSLAQQEAILLGEENDMRPE